MMNGVKVRIDQEVTSSMQDHSPLPNDSLAPSAPETESRPDARLHRFTRSLKGPAQFVSFWAAIALPFLHVPLLMGGLGGLNVTVASERAHV